MSRYPMLGRRALLRGAGVCLALPFFESLRPRELRAADPEVAKRVLYWLIPNGVIEEDWRPGAAGALSAATLPRSLKPLADVVSHVNILSGLDNLPATPDGIGDHAPGLAGFLTCASANRDNADVRLGTSADQLAAQGLLARGVKTLRPSLELSMTGPPGFCDDYPCPYGSSMSWSDPKTPRAPRRDPRDVWAYLTGATTGGPVTADEQARRLRGDTSVLDLVLEDVTSLQGKLGASDRHKLDQYATAVRRIESEISALPPTSCKLREQPPESVTSYEQRFDLMLDLQLFALECDLTRVISFMFATSFGPGSMPWAGVADDFHNLTHHEGEGDNKEKILKCIDWEVEQIAAFVARLRDTPEGEGSLLDNVSLCVSSDVGRGARHNHDNLPVLLAGRGGGAWKTGRHLVYEPEDKTARSLAGTRDPVKRATASAMPNTNKLANLHVSLLQTLGVQGAVVGNSHTALPRLTEG